ncbi:hypothetical protein O7621_21840 [Solwaraspora sp. WMMD937]|uniref:hypothetical protein n=1 Tax=Solwaraspora sp. WMMD937 TaxID=3016090 RepID=UPI00249C3882|nr:hypothetical protein [Solwaraspora sp. WMMD937]WFE20517.1 hypothetical protein O7621_21840 [Solwaraspora sp. WMMD937]
MTRADVAHATPDEEPVISVLHVPTDDTPAAAPYHPALADILIDWTGGCASCRCATLLARYPGAVLAVAAEVGRGRVAVAIRCLGDVTVRTYRSATGRARRAGPAPQRLVAVAHRLYHRWSRCTADRPGPVG